MNRFSVGNTVLVDPEHPDCIHWDIKNRKCVVTKLIGSMCVVKFDGIVKHLVNPTIELKDGSRIFHEEFLTLSNDNFEQGIKTMFLNIYRVPNDG